MREVWFAIPGDLASATGGYVYARRLLQALPAVGWEARHLALPAGFPDPSPVELEATRRSLAALPQRALVLFDGLAFGALPHSLLSGLAHRWVALVHHPLALESGLSAAAAERLAASERAALALTGRVVVTSPHTARTLTQGYGVAADRIHVALPGTERAARARGSQVPGNGLAPRLLTVATLTPRKGHDLLVQALAEVADLPWSSQVVGSLERDAAAVARLRASIAAHRLEDRIELTGELAGPALAAAYDAADLFVLPSRYEGYGMAFAEALARGLPIVACAAGAVPETVPPAAGRLVPVDDVAALAAALRDLLADPGRRRGLAEAAWIEGQRLPTWSDTAAQVAAALALA